MFSRRTYIPPIVNVNTGGGYARGGMGCGNGCGTGCVTIVAVILVIMIMFALVSSMIGSDGRDSYSASEVPASTYNREKLTGTAWDNDCVIDEIGWISEDGSVAGLERQLRQFYDKTGIQPFVYLKSYSSELVTDADKAEFASEFYEDEIANTYTFAFFYFEEEDPDSVGYMYYEGGAQALGIMDAEAVEIFWAIEEQEWYNPDTSTEDCLANIFNRTADRIMTKTTTKNDIVKIVLIIVLVIVIAAVIVFIMNKRRKQEKERNEETRRILETPLE